MAVGAVLSQIQDDCEKVVSYYSKALNKHEQVYCTTRKELLAVVCALKHFHPYLYGQPVLLRTDNAAVNWMRNLRNPQVARWLQELGTYNMTVVHRPGTKHNNADALSRKPCSACKRQQTNDDNETENARAETNPDAELGHVCVITRGQQRRCGPAAPPNTVTLPGWEPAQFRQLQLQDKDISPIMTLLDDSSDRPSWNDISHLSCTAKRIWKQWDRLVIHDGVLYRIWQPDDQEVKTQLVVPLEKQTEVIKYFHDIPSAGRLGIEKTLEIIKNKFYWPAMRKSVENYTNTCSRCSARKKTPDKRVAPLRQYLVGEPMERIEMDIMGPLPMSLSGLRHMQYQTRKQRQSAEYL